MVRSFFTPTIGKISACLDDLKRDPALAGLKYVFMVGGFSASPLLQASAKASCDGDGCRVIVAMRPDEAIVKGAVLFANDAEAFAIRKARLTYGVKTLGLYDGTDPEHVSRRVKYPYFDEDHKERIPTFSSHVKFGEDIPVGFESPRQRYNPITRTQESIPIRILASHRNDIRFPDKDISFLLGEVIIPVDMSIDYEERGVDVELVFGGTELSVNCFAAATGEEVGNVSLEIVQEEVKAG